MKLRYLFVLFLGFVLTQTACQKDSFDPVKQAAQDEEAIKNFINTNKLQGFQRDASGVYYQVTKPGTGTDTYSANTSVTVTYTGRLLNGSVFDQSANAVTFKLGQVIAGWQIGVPKIQKGGHVRILVPSAYGYGNASTGPIPANAVLDFDIELLDVKN